MGIVHRNVNFMAGDEARCKRGLLALDYSHNDDSSFSKNIGSLSTLLKDAR